MTNNSNIINRYDDMLYENRPVSLNEFLTNKYNDVHDELYNSALDKYIHSLSDKYVTKELIYECYELMSKINAFDEYDITFENIYENIFSNDMNTPFVNNLLNNLSIDRIVFFKMFYEATVNKLNNIKSKLINFYTDKNHNITSVIKDISEISDIHDFRLGYTMQGIGNEENNKKNIYYMYIDENNELIITNKVIFDNNEVYIHTINRQNLYYYIGKYIPQNTTDIYNDEGWNQIDVVNDSYISDEIYYVVIPDVCGIFNDGIEQTSLTYKSKYTFVKSMIINDNLYNVYIRTLDHSTFNHFFDDYIDINVIDNTTDDIDDIFDLICSENKEYIILYDSLSNARIGYDKDGKLILIINDIYPSNIEINYDDIDKLIKQYMNYESNNIMNIYKDMICSLYKKYHKIIEIKNSEYWMPSKVRIINKISPYTKVNVDLSDYWNMIQSNDNSNIEDLMISKETILDSELIEINYVTGKAKLQSRMNDIIYEVPFKYLNENINISDDMTLSNTFLSKYNNL